MNFIPAVSLKNKDGLKNYDIYSMLLSERIIFLTGEINEELASLIVSEILYLQAVKPKDQITIYINSPGGEVNAGLAIYDAIKASTCPISTIGIGLCASMGAIILSSGTKGLRYAYENCEIMIHQPLGGTNGQVSDLEIMTKRFSQLKDVLNKILSSNTNQSKEKVAKDCDRNFFMNANDALKYHLIDEIVSTMSSKEKS
jgi:ATP-dependent Clp protease protease subunit